MGKIAAFFQLTIKVVYSPSSVFPRYDVEESIVDPLCYCSGIWGECMELPRRVALAAGFANSNKVFCFLPFVSGIFDPGVSCILSVSMKQ